MPAKIRPAVNARLLAAVAHVRPPGGRVEAGKAKPPPTSEPYTLCETSREFVEVRLLSVGDETMKKLMIVALLGLAGCAGKPLIVDISSEKVAVQGVGRGEAGQGSGGLQSLRRPAQGRGAALSPLPGRVLHTAGSTVRLQSGASCRRV
jgi:hypothetical protein